jgi:hypothetical protein
MVWVSFLIFIFTLVGIGLPVPALVSKLHSGEINALDMVFQSQNFQAVIANEINGTGRAFVDQIYERSDKAVMLKLGVHPKDKTLTGKIQNLGFGFTYNSSTNTGLPYSLFFFKFQKEEIAPIINKIRNSVASTQRYPPRDIRFVKYMGVVSPSSQREPRGQKNILEILANYFFGPAYAKQSFCENSEIQKINEFSEELSVKYFNQLVWACTNAAETGVKKKGEELVDDLDPRNWTRIDIGSFWSSAVQTYASIKDLIPQLKPIFSEFHKQFASLHQKLKVDLICASLGAQIFEIATPGGALKKVLSLKNKLMGFKKIQSLLASISELYKQYPNSKTLEKATQGVGACAL